MADLNVQLILRLIDRATGPARAAMRAIERIGGEGLMRNAARVNRGTILMADGLGTVTGAALRGGAVLAGYAGAVVGAAALLVRPAAQFEQLKVQLTNLEGSAEGADRALRWIEDFATKTPLQLEDTVAAYAKLKAFGLDPTNGSMQAVVDTMAATGGGVEQMNGLVLALGQAWTKQKLQGEEALQMLERGVPVWDLLSEKLGKNAAELQEMASKGQLGREEITLLIEALAERNRGASESMSRTWDGIISNIIDHWGRFQRMIMASGVFDYLKDRLQLFLDLLNQMAEDGRLQQYADQVAQAIMSALEGLWAFGQGAMRVWNDLAPVIAWVADVLGGWDNLAWFAAAMMMSRTVFALIGGFLTLGRGIVLVSRGLIGIAWAMGPVALLAAAIAGAAYLIYRNWDEIGPWFRRLWASVRTYFEGMVEFVKGVFTLDFDRALQGIKQAWGGADEFFATILDGIRTNFTVAWSAISPVLDSLGLLDPITAAWRAFQDAIGAILDWIAEKFRSAMAAIKPVIEALKWVQDQKNAVVSAVGNVAAKLGTSYADRVDGDRASPLYDPGRALGGPVRAGMIYRWQEEGRELFMPRVDGDVISNRQLRAMQAMAETPSGVRVISASPGPGGRAAPGRALRLDVGGITINAAPGMDAQAVARAVRRELEALSRDRGFALHDGGDYA